MTFPVRALAMAVLLTAAFASPPAGFQLEAEKCSEDTASYRVLDASGAEVDLPLDLQMSLDCVYGVDLAPGGRFLLYPSFDEEGRETLHVYDLAEGAQSDQLKLPQAQLDAIGYAWSESPVRFAFAPGDPAYPRFYRLRVYQLSGEGRLTLVGAYDLRLKPDGDAGEPLAGKSFYFADPYTLMWKTWSEGEEEPDGPQTWRKLKLPELP